MTRTLPNLRRVKLAELAHPCPEASSGPRTRQPTARLDRWKILRLLLTEAWANPTAADDDLFERHLGALSSLEADLIRRMFLHARRVLPMAADVEIDFEGTSVHYDFEDFGVTTSVAFTLTLTHPDGSVEHVRLKTGRAASTPEEASVIWATAEAGESFLDLMAWPGELEQITPPADLEGTLRSLVETAPNLHRSGIRPGPSCVWCSRAATCGAFPASRVVPSTARTVSLTKTDGDQLARCHRQVAWRRVHGIPRDDGDDVDSPPGLTQGRLFHGLVQMAQKSADPDAAAADYLRGVPPSEVADLTVMWHNHRRMLDEEAIVVRTTEFPVGLTLTDGERAEMRGVTLIGFIDLTARDSQGRAVAVELKTGGPGETSTEDDLYAAGMHRWVEEGQPIVIHRHHVRLGECQVVTFQPADLAAATERLRHRVAVVHDWDWEDPLQPAFREGPWCAGCEYRQTCQAYR